MSGRRMDPAQATEMLAEASRLAQSGDWRAVERICAAVLEEQPENILGLYLISIANIQSNQNESAIEYLTTAVNIDQDDANKFALLSKLLCGVGRQAEALPYLRRAAALSPAPAGYNMLGAVCADCGLLGEAIDAFRRSLALQPDANIASAGLYPLLRLACDWSAELDDLSRQIDALNDAALAAGEAAPEPPLDNLHRIDDPAENLAIARSWSRALSAEVERQSPDPRISTPPAGDRRIRIGYLSGDLHDHATAHLTRGLFARHDRDRFAVHAYSYGPDDDSRYRRSIRESCDRFVDLNGIDDHTAARLIAADGIDILIDLKGYTRRNRLGICALRPAPVQITYLGFPGTSGAAFFDYAVSDEIVTPPAVAEYYTEKLIYMPSTYQCNDDQQFIPEKIIKKIDIFGTGDVFVFSSFNNPIKLDPITFDVWMNILSGTPDSILWVLQNNGLAEQNLRRRAERAGIDTTRIRFAEMLPREQHLARMTVADLALDTRLYNGHTTTSDALWAGLPVVTLEGRHFASRVSSSLLRAMGVPELIAGSLEEYARIALSIAADPARLAEIRGRIADNRATAPLFDTARFTRDLETAFGHVWDCHRRGDPPRPFAVADIRQQ